MFTLFEKEPVELFSLFAYMVSGDNFTLRIFLHEEKAESSIT